MALFQSQVLTKVSGSVGGLTYSRSTQGNYMRGRAMPVNPSSARQSQIRNILRSLTTQWTQVLTPTQRKAWDTYGRNVTRINRLGESIKISGQNWFIACNSPRLQLANYDENGTYASFESVVADAPTTYNRSDIVQTGAATLDMTDGLGITVLGTQPSLATNIVLVYMGLPQNGGRSFFRGPWRLLGATVGGGGINMDQIQYDVADLSAAYTPALANNVWFRLTSLVIDGRFSAAHTVGPLTVTQGAP